MADKPIAADDPRAAMAKEMGITSEAEFGKKMEGNMQRMMREHPEVMAKVMKAMQNQGKETGAKRPSMRGMMKILREELPAEEWEQMAGMAEKMGGKAPAPGTPAPDFTLPIMGTDETVHLSDHTGKHAVALIFGNYT